MKLKSIFLCYFSFFSLSGLTLAEDPSSWGQAKEEYLFTGARIHVAPGQVIEKGQLYIKDGKVIDVGPRVEGAQSARKIDLSGLVIHSGFLDPYVGGSKVGLEQSEEEQATPVSGNHPRVHDDYLVSQSLELEENSFKKFRDLGFVVVAVAPEKGIFRGQSAVYKTGTDIGENDLLLEAQAYSTLALEELGWGKLKGQNYPLSMMGCVALIRQTFLDSAWYFEKRREVGSGTERPEFQGSLESLNEVTSNKRPLVAESTDFLGVLRMLELTKELGLANVSYVLSGEEWRGLNWISTLLSRDSKLILPLNFPSAPSLGSGFTEDDIEHDSLRTWFAAPGNPRWLEERGFPFSFTTHRLKNIAKLEERIQNALAAGLSKRAALAALTTEPARILGLSENYGTLEIGKSASFVIRDGDLFSGNTVIREVWVDGSRHLDLKSLGKGKAPDKKTLKVRPDIVQSNYRLPPINFSEVYTPPAFLVRNATLWTQDERGTLANSDFLVSDGKIAELGQVSTIPKNTIEIDGSGLHITPGIVDAHSHTAVDGMVNEPGTNISAMVRMKDILDPFDHEIYLQLASGVTTVNILHGSANAIGGQSITCKWKRGSAPSELVMKGAPEGIKFALGENPKTSNWGDEHTSRYPQSRMGVIQLIRGAFLSARNYQSLKSQGLKPKPDLVLDALVEVLEGKRIVHCHSYRQDEILALIRTAEEIGFRVNVFQHVLEGYKVAKEIAAHGAAASTFADWWAYKVEVEDAIPYNTTLMAQAGVNVSVNSDSNDLARRLNTEAAKSVRYGGMTEVEALNMITRNGAYQLGVLDRIGTLTEGKDADFVIWSDHPLTQEAKVLATWIEGKRYFKRGAEAKRVALLAEEKRRFTKLLNVKKGKGE